MQVLAISLLSNIEERDTKRALYATADPVLFHQKKTQQKTNLSIFLEFKGLFLREIDSLSQYALIGSPKTYLSIYK